ncbi:hypothetical protein NDU88_002403 [Pleurodeles waltl]|uniref:Uncharacterized protein n=1 Tax=Pleurodeles waltl TaxID=8319 RepID=A0AAV7P6N7_PLEWA|nr:hypothetical protein NDU88_002403 [Pleurodeles waltl]
MRVRDAHSSHVCLHSAFGALILSHSTSRHVRVERRPSEEKRKERMEERSGPVKSGESRAARVPWREVQAEPRVASRCTSTGSQKKRTSTADAPDGGCGGTGLASDDAAPRWEQRRGPSRRGEVVRRASLEPQQGVVTQTTRTAGIQGGDSWCDETCVLDFDEDSVEEGEFIEEGEEENWWAKGGVGPANALSKSFQRPRQVQPAVKKISDGSQIGRRKAEERLPSLTAGEDSVGVCRVSVAVEGTEDLGTTGGGCYEFAEEGRQSWAEGIGGQFGTPATANVI